MGAEAARFESPDQLLPYLKTVKNSQGINERKRAQNNDGKIEYASKEEGGKNKDRSSIRCFNCMQDGHYVSSCPKPILRCDTCLRYGHTKEKCRNATSTAGADTKTTN